MYTRNLLKQKACQHHSKTHAKVKSPMIKLPCCQRKHINTNIWDKTLQPYKYYLNYQYKTAESFSTHNSTHTNAPMLKTAAHKYKSSYFNVKLYISWLIIIFFNLRTVMWRFDADILNMY